MFLYTTGPSSSIPYYTQNIKEGLDFEWNIASLPHLTTTPVQNVYGPSLSVLKTSREAELASWLFIKYLARPDAQEYWAKSTYYYPVRTSTGEGLSDFNLENPQYSTGGDLFAYGKSEPSLPGYVFVRELAAESLAAILRGLDASQVLSELTMEANTLLMKQIELPLSTIESIPIPNSGE
jgi:sn-glycerol 3-phosphate transport system substrate-binding protein